MPDAILPLAVRDSLHIQCFLGNRPTSGSGEVSVSWTLLLEGVEAGFADLRVCCLGGHVGCAGGTEGT